MFWLIFKLFVAANFLLSFVVIASAYKHERRQHLKHSQMPSKLPLADLPTLSIIVPAHNEETTVLRCLESIYATQYSKMNIIVVNDGSTDRTAAVVRAFKNGSNKQNLRLISLRKNRGKGEAMNYAIKKYVDSDLTMIVDADVELDKSAIERAVRHFTDNNIVALASNVRISESSSLLSTIQQIEFMIGFFHKKFFDATNSEFIIGGQGSVYRTKTIRKAGYFKGNMQTEDIALSINVLKTAAPGEKIAFGSDVLVYTHAVSTIKDLMKQRYRWKFGAMQALFANKEIVFSRDKRYSKFMTWYRLPNVLFSELLLLIEPLILFLFLYVAIISRSPFVFVGTWATFSLYAGAIVVSDPYLSTASKYKLALRIPFLFPAFYIFNFVNVYSMIKCVINWKQLLGKASVSGSWISPSRANAQKIA